MVDLNPARGMPLPLKRYWLAGKGAAKIRWGMPHDFNRCVRNLRKYFPKNPEGLCNILHQQAVGAPPGKGHGDHAMTAAAQALMAKQPELGDMWAGPIAPIGRPTGEPTRMRVFDPGALKHRTLPLPLSWQKIRAPGHEGSVTVGRVLGISYGPDHEGQDSAWAWGDWLNADIVPEVKEARYLVEQGVAGPSVTPGGRMVGTRDPATSIDHMTEYTIGDVTLVSIPAFASMRLYNLIEGDWPDDDPDMPESYGAKSEPDCGCGGGYGAALDEGLHTFAVNPAGWRGLPLAARDSVFDNDDAIKRIAAWANVTAEGADVDKLRRAFMWRDSRQPETNPTSYRLPVGDIVNGRLTLIFHAIYAAAALISGAHGGLPNVPEEDKNQLRNVITEIYEVMAAEFNDASMKAPWDRPENEGKEFAVTEDPSKPYGDVEYADPGYQSDSKKRYPIDTLEHAKAAWSYINQHDNERRYDPEQLTKVKERIQAALKRFDVQVKAQAPVAAPANYSSWGEEFEFPLAPPVTWFFDPKLGRKTKLTVTEEGRIYGHLAAWGECHRDVTMRECVLAPHSQKGYAPFHLGTVMVDDGSMLEVGKVVMDTRHAGIRLSYAAAALHYDNTGDEVAVIRAGEDEFGIWVAGAVVPEATSRKVAKLRRSPLSGDWRAVDGHLELTAALAVNVPAFPVYAMDGDEQLALVAAGSVWPDVDDDEPEADMAALFASMKEQVERLVDEEQEQEDRAWELRVIDEADQDVLAAQLEEIFAADEEVQATAPVAGDDTAALASDAAMSIRQRDAQFQVISEPDDSDPDDDDVDEAAARAVAPAPAAAPVPAAPVAQ